MRQQTEKTWIISEVEGGFRVYSPSQPRETHLVSGTPENPNCSCHVFQEMGEECEHIVAVAGQFNWSPTERPDDQEVRRSNRQERGPTGVGNDGNGVNGDSQMLLKRSISPDGRIDSLSIEFSCPVDGVPAGTIRSLAARTLELQSEIAENFLSQEGNQNRSEGPPPQQGSDGAVSARMISIGGLDGRWGRRLFINFRLGGNGRFVKLFGTKQQLAQALADAGFPDYGQLVDEGLSLQLPCRIVTKPGKNPKYLDVEKVMPIESGGGYR